MMLSAAATARRKHHHDIGTHRTDDAHDVRENVFLTPFLESFFDAERVAELIRPSEVLLDTVEAVHRHQLFGSENPDSLEELRADLVLPAVTPRRRQKRRPESSPATEHDEEPIVLVVRVRRRVQERRARAELSELKRETGGTAVFGNRLELRRGNRRSESARQSKDYKAFHVELLEASMPSRSIVSGLDDVKESH